MDPAVALGELAAAAARAAVAGTGRYHYVRTEGRYLSSSQLLAGDRLRHLESHLESVERELWLAEDGSGRIAETRDGRRSDVSGDYGPGELSFPDWPQLDGGRVVVTPGRSPWRILDEVWSNRLVPSTVQAELLDALAHEAHRATVTPAVDPLGRAGIAIAVAEAPVGLPPSRYAVVLSTDTGALLAAEEIALEPADWLVEEPPCSTSRTTFVASGVVDHLGSRPSPSW